MINILINETPHAIPQCWDDVTVERFCAYQICYRDLSAAEIDLGSPISKMRLFAAITGVDYDVLMSEHVTRINIIAKHLIFVFDDIAALAALPTQFYFEHDATKYEVFESITDAITMFQFCELDMIYAKIYEKDKTGGEIWEKVPALLSAMCMPHGTFWDENKRMDIERAAEYKEATRTSIARAKELQSLPITIAYPLISFFLLNKRTTKNASKNYLSIAAILTAWARAELHQQLHRAKYGAGGTRFTRWLNTIQLRSIIYLTTPLRSI